MTNNAYLKSMSDTELDHEYEETARLHDEVFDDFNAFDYWSDTEYESFESELQGYRVWLIAIEKEQSD